MVIYERKEKKLKEEKEKSPEFEEKKQSGEVSRRDFLVGAGTVVVGGLSAPGYFRVAKAMKKKPLLLLLKKPRRL